MRGCLRGYLPVGRWCFCVGAGISRGIAPTWFALTNAVVNEVFGVSLDADAFNALVAKSGWSLDGWLQAAANEHLRLRKSLEDFTSIIESLLYSEIRQKAKGCGLERYLTAVLSFPQNEPKQRVMEVCDFLENSFSDCSLFNIARALIDSAKSGRGPRAVLSFNADTFLETYIDLYLRREHYKGPGPHGHPKYYFLSVSRTTTDEGDKIPIYHCHGSIAPYYDLPARHRDARDRLVFLEREYLAMSSSRASWSETIFLFHAQSAKLAFAGLSMSDANIRRWMSMIVLARQRKLWVLRGYTEG